MHSNNCECSVEREKKNWKVHFWPLVLGHKDVLTTYCRNTTVTTTNGINHFMVILGLYSINVKNNGHYAGHYALFVLCLLDLPINKGGCTCASEQIALLLSSCLPHVVCNCPVFTVMYIQQIVPYALKNKAVAFVLFCQGYMLVMM